MNRPFLLATCLLLGFAALLGQGGPERLQPPYLADLFHGQFRAPDPPAMPRPDPSALTGMVRDGQLELTLEQAIRLAVRHNLQVQLQRYDVLESEQGFFGAGGIFEPRWRHTAAIGRDTAPAPSIFQGVGSAVEKERLYSTGVTKFMDTGTLLQADLSLRRYANNNSFYLVNPGYNTVWTLGLKQNLLKGAGRSVNRAPVLIAENTLRLAQADFRHQLTEVVLEVARQYWDLVYLEENLRLTGESLALAERTRDDVAVQVEVGLQPELNLYKARAEVAHRRGEHTQAGTALRNASRRLLSLLTPDAQAGLDSAPDLRPVDRDPRVTDAPTRLDDAVRQALEQRPEIEAARHGLTVREIQERIGRNAVLPDLSLEASYSQYGLKGQISDLNDLPFPVPPETADLLRRAFAGGAWDSLTNSFRGKYNGFRLAVNLVIPIGNAEGRANARRATLSRERQQTTLDMLRQAVVLEVAAAHRLVDQQRALIESAGEALRAAERNLDGEQAKYDAGVVVVRDLLEAQRDLLAARIAEHRARIDYRHAVLVYNRAAGRLLDDFGIQTVAALKGE